MCQEGCWPQLLLRFRKFLRLITDDNILTSDSGSARHKNTQYKSSSKYGSNTCFDRHVTLKNTTHTTSTKQLRDD